MPAAALRLSRRHFLAAGLAAAVFGSRSKAVAADADPNRFALLSDTHIPADVALVKNKTCPAENFRAALADILKQPTRPAATIVTGDCAYIEGLPGDYRSLRSLSEPLRAAGVPLHWTLGNHDHRENFYAAFPEYRPPVPAVPGKHVALVESPRANWLLLDSLNKTNVVDGLLGEEQLAWVGRTLDAHPDKPALLAFHHNPNPPGKTSGLADFDALVKVIAPRKQAKAVFYGHSHRWEQATVDGIHLVNLPAMAWLFDAKQPRAWVECGVCAGGMDLILRTTDAADARRGQRLELAWR